MKAERRGKLAENHIGIIAETDEEREVLTGLVYRNGHELYIVAFSDDTDGKVKSLSLSVRGESDNPS
ncbi:hypothetical protein LCGC14_0927040 [marine sediment metagenome]|uniref:Uncharacterized protein n=1 Tax=marine sediment metagenome TaxID=412755 RepID=A0A0F9RVU4_9ZZZZ